MYYDMDNMNDIDVRSSNNFLRKVFLYMVLGVAISFGTGIYLYQFNQELLFSLSRYFNILFIGSIGIVLVSDFMLKKLSASILRILFLLYSLIIGTVFSTNVTISYTLCFWDCTYNICCDGDLWIYIKRRFKFL